MLLFVPAFTSLVLGVVYLVPGEGRPALEGLGVRSRVGEGWML